MPLSDGLVRSDDSDRGPIDASNAITSTVTDVKDPRVIALAPGCRSQIPPIVDAVRPLGNRRYCAIPRSVSSSPVSRRGGHPVLAAMRLSLSEPAFGELSAAWVRSDVTRPPSQSQQQPTPKLHLVEVGRRMGGPRRRTSSRDHRKRPPRPSLPRPPRARHRRTRSRLRPTHRTPLAPIHHEPQEQVTQRKIREPKRRRALGHSWAISFPHLST